MPRRLKSETVPQQITFKYIFADDYNPLFANGVYGGVTPSGEIVMNFYLERHALPDHIVHALTPEGALGDEMRRTPEDHRESLVRVVDSGVILTVDGAKAIHAWLGEKIEAAARVQKIKRAPTRSRKEEPDA